MERTGKEQDPGPSGKTRKRGLRERMRLAVAAHKSGAARAPSDSEPDAKPTTVSPPLEDLLGGSWKETPHGPAFVKEEWFAPEHVHGRFTLGSLLGDATCDARALLGDAPATALSPARLGYFDLETTGTSGGTGTYAFLAGLGCFIDGRFRLRQYFLANLSEERAMLSLLLNDLAQLEGIVTYNGKTFDVPCIRSRATLARLPLTAIDKPHIDLLHLVRRLRGHRMESCRLADAEGELLGFFREDDTPGWLVPSLYFDYVRAQRVTPLRGVLRHNRDDILSLVGVLLTLHLFLNHTPRDGEDTAALARWWERACDFDRASSLYRQALAQLEGSTPWTLTARRHSLLLKRRGAREEAAALWQRLWAAGDRWAGVELAKHLEHRTRELGQAELTTAELLRDAPAGEREALQHRLERLQRKQTRPSRAKRRRATRSPET